MATMTEIREGMAAALGGVLDGQISPWLLSDPTLPSLQVFPSDIDYDSAMARGHDDWLLTVQVLFAVVSDVGAQQRLDELLAPSGTSSVKEALEVQPPLGGIVDDLRVEACSGYRVYARGSAEPALGAEWRVRIME